MAAPPTPLQQAIDRLVFETQYVRDVLHVAGPGVGVTTISTRSLQQLFDGLAWTIDTLRATQPALTVPTVVPGAVPAGGTAPPTTGG